MSPESESASKNTDLAFKIVSFGIFAALAVYTIHELKVLIICIIFAMTLASAIAPVAEWLETKKVPRLLTVLVIYFVTAVIYAALGASLVPTLIDQAKQLYQHVPQYLDKLLNYYQQALNLAGENGADAAAAINVDEMRGLAMKFVGKTLDLSAGFAGLLINTVLTLFLTAFFVVEAKRIVPTLLNWLPQKLAARLAPLVIPLEAHLGGYVRGQLLVALAVASILTGGFLAIGLKYAMVLGLVAGLLNLVPYVGSMIATGLAIVVAFNQDPLLALAVIGIYALEQWLESSFLVPHLLGKNVDLHPLVVLLAILCGASLLGVAGALIAIPITSAAILLAEEFYLKPMKLKEAGACQITEPPGQVPLPELESGSDAGVKPEA